MKNKIKSQAFLEYTVLIIIAAAALLAMRIYFMRAVQEKYRQSADVFGEGEQYAPGVTQVTEMNEKSFDPVAQDANKDTCANIVARVKLMQNELNGSDQPVGCKAPDCVHVAGLIELAKKYEAQAVDIDGQVAILTKQGMTNETVSLIESARVLREKAAFLRDKAQLKQDQIINLKLTRPECFR